MKIKHLLISLLLSCTIFSTSYSQKLISVEHAGKSFYFRDFASAVESAVSGDTIYIPGGVFNEPFVEINKELHLIGVGYHPDSTLSTKATYFSGKVILNPGSENSSLTGIRVNELELKSAPFNIFRCNLVNLYISYTVSPESSLFTRVSESIIQNFSTYGEESNNFHFLKCIFNMTSTGKQGINNSIFQNSIFYGPLPMDYGSNVYLNNILTAEFYSVWSDLIITSDALFNNNLFVGTDTTVLKGTINSNVFIGPDQPIFMNANSGYNGGEAIDPVYADFHLVESCPGRNAGTDGTDVGIFGTDTPFKLGGLPFIPHISYKKIDNEPGPDGKISIEVKVTTQQN